MEGTPPLKEHPEWLKINQHVQQKILKGGEHAIENHD